jgi:hypothetical protein
MTGVPPAAVVSATTGAGTAPTTVDPDGMIAHVAVQAGPRARSSAGAAVSRPRHPASQSRGSVRASQATRWTVR